MDASPTDRAEPGRRNGSGPEGWWPSILGFPPDDDEAPGEPGDPGAARMDFPREIDFGLGPVDARPRRGVGSGERPAWDRRMLVADIREVRPRPCLTPADPGGWGAGPVARTPDLLSMEDLTAIAAAARAACGPADAPEVRAGSTAA